MGLETALAIAGTLATVAGTTVGIVQGAKAKKSAAQAPKTVAPTPQLLQAPGPLTAGEDTKLKPGERMNLINTSPQGVLDPSTSRRKTLLGG